MTEYFQGRVLEITETTAGSELTSDHASGVTQLNLYDVEAFSENGGQLEIQDEIYDYTMVDPDSTYLLIDPPLITAAEADLQVFVYPFILEKQALVEISGLFEDAVTARVPHSLYDALDTIVREENDQESVSLSLEQGKDWLIRDVLGSSVTRSGRYIDPTTLPEPEAPEAPLVSPALRAVGMPNSIMLIADPIAGTDWLTYQFSTDGVAWTTLDNMPSKQTSWVVADTPTGSPLQLLTTYYFQVIAGNAAGNSPTPSNVATAQLDTAAVSIVAGQVVTAELISEAIQAGIVRVGSNITISADNGIEILQSDGGFTRLPSDGSSPQFTGEIVARALTVENGASIYGESDVSGSIELNAAIKDPLTAPTTDAYYDVRDMGALYNALYGVTPSTVGLCRNLANNGWVTIITRPDLPGTVWNFLEVLDTNVVNRYTVQDFGQNAMGSIVVCNGKYYWMYRTSTASWYVVEQAVLSTSTGNPSSLWGTAATGMRASRPGLGTNGTSELYIARIDAGDVTTVRIDTSDLSISITNSEFFASGVTGSTDINGIYVGNADYGSARRIVQYSTGVRVYNTTPSGGWDGTYVSADGWPKPYNWTPNSLHWDGTYFRSIDPYGRIARLEPKATLTPSWWAYAWVDSDTHTTLVSPRKNWTPPNRSLVTVTSSQPPQVAVAGTHVANRIQVYAASTLVGTLYKQGGALPIGTFAWPYNPIREVVTAAPGSNNWGGVVVPGELRSSASDADGKYVDIDGSGDGRAGPYRWTAAGSSGPPIGTLYYATGSHVTNLATSTITVVGSGWTGGEAIGVGSGKMFSAYSAGVWTMAYAGTYEINASISFDSHAAGRRVVMVYINGTHRRRIDVGSGGTCVPQIIHNVVLAAGDTVEIRAFQSSGVTLALDGGSVPHWFQMRRTL